MSLFFSRACRAFPSAHDSAPSHPSLSILALISPSPSHHVPPTSVPPILFPLFNPLYPLHPVSAFTDPVHRASSPWFPPRSCTTSSATEYPIRLHFAWPQTPPGPTSSTTRSSSCFAIGRSLCTSTNISRPKTLTWGTAAAEENLWRLTPAPFLRKRKRPEMRPLSPPADRPALPALLHRRPTISSRRIRFPSAKSCPAFPD